MGHHSPVKRAFDSRCGIGDEEQHQMNDHNKNWQRVKIGLLKLSKKTAIVTTPMYFRNVDPMT